MKTDAGCGVKFQKKNISKKQRKKKLKKINKNEVVVVDVVK